MRTIIEQGKALIAEHRAFFKGQTDIEQVIVLGHSLSEVDAAYFHAVRKQNSVAAEQWCIACRSLNEWPEKEALLIHLGDEPDRTIPVLGRKFK